MRWQLHPHCHGHLLLVQQHSFCSWIHVGDPSSSLQVLHHLHCSSQDILTQLHSLPHLPLTFHAQGQGSGANGMRQLQIKWSNVMNKKLVKPMLCFYFWVKTAGICEIHFHITLLIILWRQCQLSPPIKLIIISCLGGSMIIFVPE
jgi:hypothetical protein